MNKIIINANCDLGITVCGSEEGPRDLTKDLKNLNIINIDKSDVLKETEKDNLSKNFNAVNEFNEKLYNEIIKHDEFVITIGGDHSISIASALASVKKNPGIGIIWIDAHPDYNTFETTITGNIHGLPLASIAGQNGNKLTYFHNSEYISDSKTVIVGARSIDEGEQKNIDKTESLVFTTNDVFNLGVKKTMQQAFERAGKNNKVHISFDVDVIDPILAPGVSVPEIDGINYEQAEEIFDFLIANKEKIASLDIVEYNPIRDKNEITYKFIKKLLKRIVD